MFLVGALFALVTIGLVVPCLIEVAVAPDHEVRGLAKHWWVLLLVFGSVLGVAAWLIAGRPRARSRARMSRSYRGGVSYLSHEDALRRHPAGQGAERGFSSPPGQTVQAGVSVRPMGPDDDPAFLEELARRINRGDQAGNDA
jgi:4-amino-4-deoxy-L-arabinose transferase-like glycosyltransferase